MVTKTYQPGQAGNKDEETPTNKGAFDVMAHPSRRDQSSGNNAGVSGNTI